MDIFYLKRGILLKNRKQMCMYRRILAFVIVLVKKISMNEQCDMAGKKGNAILGICLSMGRSTF